ACPNGWALSGEWQCGTPTVVGPPAAFSGTKCLGTVLNGQYSNSDDFATTTATTPSITLPPASSPKLSFRTWVETEGSTFDGFNLKVSTDGGASYTIVNSVTPTYPLTLGSVPPEAAWGGDQSGLGWQLYQADLTAYAGQNVLLRFAFRSDGSVQHDGVYI